MALESALFSAIGSVLCYVLFGERKRGFDYMNLAVMISWACVGFTPIAYNWYPFLEEVSPGNELSNVLIKVAMDQLIMSPIFVVLFWLYSTFLATLDTNAAINTMKSRTKNTLLTNWMYWPLVQLINIGFVSDLYKITFINLASIPWNIYIAWAVSQSDKETKSTPKKK
eukprot:410377_1